MQFREAIEMICAPRKKSATKDLNLEILKKNWQNLVPDLRNKILN